ncbi:cation-translocating P-type ATPase [Corynebacterium liangguodongii]|uniref:Haloacid dehalogenase n=1 Tax=Corynebacterium liangguodongii TaxID=2079535 RepID=A0A2S0WEM8_9CORY|nr:cation-translocating P-type ATPase [Corynebacterium liangguodongii]AWB84184.1 haloacid dehalogenase [Corynebacterium liangguodongii]PWC00195.1 cation-translocating P-type ATPase [Corynebacterium liangguodongii]
MGANKHPSQYDTTEVIRHFETAPGQGLTEEEARLRLEKYGPNELRQKPPVPLWRKILAQFQDPLVYLLFVAMAISLVAWLIEGASGVPVDVVVIAAIVIANAMIGLAQENKAEGAVAALSEMTVATSTVLRGGKLATIPATDIVPGDVLVLGEGDSVGADARLISSTDLRIQESSLTGESEAAEKDTETLDTLVGVGDRRNMVHKGTAVVQGVGRAVVTATGMDSEMGEIADMLDTTEQDPSPLEREIEKVSKMLGVLVIGIAVVVMGALFIINGVSTAEEAIEVLLLGVSLAVAAVPEGLPAILSLVLAIGVQSLAKHNAVMKDLHSVETLGAASVIASDKTGTLTRNEMTLRTVLTASGTVELSGTGYAPEGEATGDKAALEEARLVVAGGAIANNAQLNKGSEWTIEGDPTEAAFIVAKHKMDGIANRTDSFERRAEVPFSSERKLMSVAGRDAEAGEVLVTKGAPDVLLARCTSRRVGGEEVALDTDAREELLASVEALSSEGYRTLGVAYRLLDSPADTLTEDDEAGLVFLGVVGIIDPPREEAIEAIRLAHDAGIRTMMITGDHPRTAAKIGADIGAVKQGAEALTGEDIGQLDDASFRNAVRTINIYARVAPKHKLRIVDALQDDGRIVAMTGDGVNDAPALKSADIGVAMGITGTEVTKEAGTMILADDNYATIISAVRQGREIFDNIRKFLRFLLSSNMGEVVTVLFGVIFAGLIGLTESAEGLAVPLLATQILWVNLVTDSGPALAMGVDPEVGDLMSRPPRDPRAPIIDRSMWARILFIGGVMGAVTLLAIDMFLPGGLATIEPVTLEVARTVGFSTVVFAQLFNALNSRSSDRSAFRGLFANRWLWASIALAVALQIVVVHVPFMQVAFGTSALSPLQWAVSIGMASVVLWAEELVKAGRRGIRT